MKVRVNNFLDALTERIFFAPDTGGGDGGGDGNDETFTKEQVEQMIQGRVTKLKSTVAELQKQLTDAQKTGEKVAALEAKIAELSANNPPTPANPSDLEGKLKLLESKHANEIKQLTEKVSTLNTEREAEKTRRMQVERDTALGEALTEAGCRPDAISVGKAFLGNQVSYDAEEERWVYTLRTGGTVSVKDGVTQELPDYLKEPTLRNGGSGSSSGGKNSQKRTALQEAKAELQKAQQAAMSGREDDMAKYMSLKRKVGQLEAELV